MFYRVLFHYFEKFLSEYEYRFEREYGFLRPVVYEANPLICPQCGGRMPACALHADRTIISFIEDHKIIDEIIHHLKLTFQAERPPLDQAVQQELLMAAEEGEKYF